MSFQFLEMAILEQRVFKTLDLYLQLVLLKDYQFIIPPPRLENSCLTSLLGTEYYHFKTPCEFEGKKVPYCHLICIYFIPNHFKHLFCL